jgi:sugar lactone lactonase YvrE
LDEAMNLDIRQVLVAPTEGYFEGARWHDDALWFSDFRNRTVSKLLVTGEVEAVAQIPGRPGGLGFDPSGAPLVVSIEDCALWRLGEDGAVEALGSFGEDAFGTHDMTVDRAGRAYVAQWGYDLLAGEPARATGILVRHPDGEIDRYGEGLILPNGIAISADERTLIVAESYAEPRTKLTAFDIAADGSLSGQRVFAEFGAPETDVPDGLCIDMEGAVWVAFPFRGEFRRVREGGEITHVISIPRTEGSHCVDCALGGPELRTLFLVIADTDMERLADNFGADSRIEAVEVYIPGIPE